MRKVFGWALIDSLGTAAYIMAIVLFISSFEKVISGIEETILIPVFMLMFFVFSAAFTGSLVLGRPILWYFDGKKKEAVLLFISTLIILFILILIIFLLWVWMG